ncbi:hypothetical protein, partial [Mycobacterium tuberculosis]
MPEQSHDAEVKEVGRMLTSIMRSEDTSRPLTNGMNYARPENEGADLVEDVDVISLNYQGAGVGDTYNFAGKWGYM